MGKMHLVVTPLNEYKQPSIGPAVIESKEICQYFQVFTLKL